MPRDDDRLWQWGKFKGTPLQEMSTDYLQWAVKNFKFDKAVKVAEKELKFRGDAVPTERSVETPEQQAISKLQWDVRRVTAQLTNLTEGLNRLLVASNLASVTLEPSVKGEYDKPKPDKKAKSVYNDNAPWEPEVIGNPLDDDTPF